MNTKNESVHYVHIRKDLNTGLGKRIPATKGGATIAYIYDTPNKRIVFAVAMCSFRDNFCRRIGRAVATGRLSNNIDTASISYDMIGVENKEYESPSYSDVAKYFNKHTQP